MLGARQPRHLFQKEQCDTCHLFPERSESFVRSDAFRQSVNALCCACHESERTGVGHRVGMRPSMRVPEDLPLDADGRLTCATCHDPHETEGLHPHLLRRDAGRALCTACHADGIPLREPPAVEIVFPAEGAVVPPGETVIAGRVAGPAVAEVRISSGTGTFAVPVVRGGFVARLPLSEGGNDVSISAGRSTSRFVFQASRAASSWTSHLTSGTGQCASCHPGWETRGFFSAAPVAESCYRCHQRLDRLPTTHRPVAAGECAASCHDPHGGGASLPAAAPARACLACHEEAAANRHLLAANRGRSVAVPECTGCHDPHQSTRRNLTTSGTASLAIAVELEAPEPALGAGTAAESRVELPGFGVASEPGRPALPERIITLAVPPGADPLTARLKIVSEERVDLPGRHQLLPAPPAATYVGGRSLSDWGSARNVRDRKDPSVYSKNAPWPPAALTLEKPAAFRDLALVRVAFRPLSYNPVRGTLTLTRRLVAELEFSPARPERHRERLRGSSVGTAAADLGVRNARRAGAWSPAPVRPSPARSAGVTSAPAPSGAQQAAASLAGDAVPAATDYVVITTRATAAASTALQSFIDHKASLGLRVRTLTEDDYGTAAAGKDRAVAIRQWLKDHYLADGIRYALLVGNPHPETGDVPMLRAWPRRGATYAPEYLDAPTDLFYADLSGSWDLDSDGWFGEARDDGGPGGVDFVPEVFVGRIPVYGADVASLDAVLLKTIAYETAAGDLSWRRSVLLPMSFSDASTDGAYLAEQMKTDYLTGRGFTPLTMYQQGSAGGPVSAFASDAELRGGSVQSSWSTAPYGVVAWWGHGSSTRTLIGYSGAWDGDLLTSSTATLDDSAPAFVYQTACLNGYPEYEGNLGYALLKRGAIATVAASRVSWYYPGQQDFRSSPSNAGIGYLYLARLSAGDPAGKALLLAKGDPSLAHSSDSSWMNLMDFNLYGDPSVGLFRGPVIQLSTTALAFTVVEGEEEPQEAAIAITSGDAALDLQAFPEGPWLSATPLEARSPSTLTVNALPAGLPAGTYLAQVVLMSNGAANSPLALPATLRVARPGRLAGRVLSPGGAGVAGATVSLQGPRSRTAVTDATGAYEFALLPPGSYALTASSAGYSFLPRTDRYDLSEGESRLRNFTARTFEIRGRVTRDSNGKPIPKVAVQLRDASGVVLRQVLTGATGSYAIRKLGPGSYVLRARLSGWRFSPVSIRVRIGAANVSNRNFKGSR